MVFRHIKSNKRSCNLCKKFLFICIYSGILPAKPIEQTNASFNKSFSSCAGIKSGFYNTKLTLNYAGKSTEKLIKTEITMNSIKMNLLGQAIALEGRNISRDTIFTLFIIVLIVINIFWFVYFKRKKQKDL